jgi:hypothetical protein
MPSIAGQLNTYRNGGRSCEVLAIGQKKARDDGARRIYEARNLHFTVSHQLPRPASLPISSTLLACSTTNCPSTASATTVRGTGASAASSAGENGVAQPLPPRLQPAAQRAMRSTTMRSWLTPSPHLMPAQPRPAPPSTAGGGSQKRAAGCALVPARTRPRKGDRRLPASIG